MLGTTMGLEPGGTNLEIRLMVAFIGPGTADAPREFSGALWMCRFAAAQTKPARETSPNCVSLAGAF